MFLLATWVSSPSNRLLAISVKAHIYHNASMGQCCKVASVYSMKIFVVVSFIPVVTRTKGRKSLGQRSREGNHPFFDLF